MGVSESIWTAADSGDVCVREGMVVVSTLAGVHFLIQKPREPPESLPPRWVLG